ncbi:hypothetical protein [Micromonospora sp. B9E7]|uniref:hypothetical protein n=1 Tax=Micromonospora sp. B9E7 TaxID=3153574 RepID=UPI00325C902E
MTSVQVEARSLQHTALRPKKFGGHIDAAQLDGRHQSNPASCDGTGKIGTRGLIPWEIDEYPLPATAVRERLYGPVVSGSQS